MSDNFLPEEAVWEEGVRQIETTDVVLGGQNGVPNIAPRQLANRTRYLKDKIESNGASEQFALYNSTRIYVVGDVCYTKDSESGVVTFWEWYSNVESLAGKDPLSSENRQTGWADDTKPFYWTPYKKARSGTPLWPWLSETFPEGTLNVVGNSVPTAVFWRLAEAFPEYINGINIDFPETSGEFFRVLDQSRGIDADRAFGSLQNDSIQYHNHLLPTTTGQSGTQQGIPDYTFDNTEVNYATGTGDSTPYTSAGSHGNESGDFSDETRPRNLAFPILVEV